MKILERSKIFTLLQSHLIQLTNHLSIVYVLMLLCLLWCNVRMQTCANSSTQTPVEFRFYVDGSSSAYRPYDMVMDGSLNQYLVYSTASGGNIHISKINTTGDIEWSKEYPDLYVIASALTTQISNGGDTIRMIGGESPNNTQFVQISTCKYCPHKNNTQPIKHF